VGKSTAAACLKPLGYHRISFADPLKQMLMTLGLTYEQVYGAEKEIPSPLLCGQTPRWAMQTLGTEWGREYIHQDLWVRAWQHRCQSHQLVTVDDMRFPNEYKMVKALGGVVIGLVREREIPTTQHESEAHKFELDNVIMNTGPLERFKRDVLFAVQSF
jgi:hypothetical protein